MDSERVCDVCDEPVPEAEVHICRGCLLAFCGRCWEEEAYQVYDLCGDCGVRVEEGLYWDGKILEWKEEYGCR